ncbi:hypothetical protein ACKVMT_07070 [Halobacteriales archaeon Cl-PHB]
MPDSLPDKFDPQDAKPLNAITKIGISGIGAVLTTLFIGIASIPTGVVIGVQNVTGALRTWLSAFISGFFEPFVISVRCASTGGVDCNPTYMATIPTKFSVQVFGILGFVAAIVTVGAVAYVVARGVEMWSG